MSIVIDDDIAAYHKYCRTDVRVALLAGDCAGPAAGCIVVSLRFEGVLLMHCDSERTGRLLELNRLLIEEKGDAFAQSLAEFIQVEGLLIGDAALMTLLSAARSVRRGATCAQDADIRPH